MSNWRLEPSHHASERHYGVREGCRCLLREIVADAAANRTVLVPAGKARPVCCRLGVRRTVLVDGTASVMIMTTKEIPLDPACLERHGWVGPG